jgi:xanthine/uracil permease
MLCGVATGWAAAVVMSASNANNIANARLMGWRWFFSRIRVFMVLCFFIFIHCVVG